MKTSPTDKTISVLYVLFIAFGLITFFAIIGVNLFSPCDNPADKKQQLCFQ